MVVISNKRYTIKRNTKSLLKYQKNKISTNKNSTNKISTNKNKRTKKKSVNQVGHVGQVGSGFFFTSKYAKDIKAHTMNIVEFIISNYYNSINNFTPTNKDLKYILDAYKRKLQFCLYKCIKGILQHFYKSDNLKSIYKAKYPNTKKAIDYKTTIIKDIQNIIINIFTNPNPNPNKNDTYANKLKIINNTLKIEIITEFRKPPHKNKITQVAELKKSLQYICNDKNKFIKYCIKEINIYAVSTQPTQSRNYQQYQQYAQPQQSYSDYPHILQRNPNVSQPGYNPYPSQYVIR